MSSRHRHRHRHRSSQRHRHHHQARCLRRTKRRCPQACVTALVRRGIPSVVATGATATTGDHQRGAIDANDAGLAAACAILACAFGRPTATAIRSPERQALAWTHAVRGADRRPVTAEHVSAEGVGSAESTSHHGRNSTYAVRHRDRGRGRERRQRRIRNRCRSGWRRKRGPGDREQRSDHTHRRCNRRLSHAPAAWRRRRGYCSDVFHHRPSRWLARSANGGTIYHSASRAQTRGRPTDESPQACVTLQLHLCCISTSRAGQVPIQQQYNSCMDGVPVLYYHRVRAVRTGAGPTARRQKFLGSPSPRRAMMFFWISDAPPPIVSITV